MSILSLQNISIKNRQHLLLNNVGFTVKPSEHWLLVGQSGSGKTVLLNAIAGVMPPTAGILNYGPDVKNRIALVTSKHHFKDKTNTSSNLYYQQRYNSSDSDQALIVAEYLENKQPAVPGSTHWTVDKVVSLFQLEHLLSKELIKLSNGETKRLRIASALLAQPKVLLLDDPLSGLDQQTQRSFSGILTKIIETGITIVMSGSGQEIPTPITHAAVLEHGTVTHTMPVEELSPLMTKPTLTIKPEAIEALTSGYVKAPFEWVIKMSHVNVEYDKHIILNDVDWLVKPGEKWALFGHNGAGKSTLLSLINGDNPQAYANDIILFDKKRGTGESIWDIKQNIGFLSPELYQYFPADQSALQVIESGFYDTQGLFRPSSAAKAEKALQWLKALNIDQYATQLLKNLPASAQRLCLLARAVIKNPYLLILDEPCQGLDQQQRVLFNQLVDAIVEATGVTLIYVTHYLNELPLCINQTLKLDQGKVVNS
ncbi:ATP-binding cassette domain-containing protein [Mucilaginibacter sp. PAMB04274]|uniref:ATP-binding cassette domain-containing protein n=1 Tax=Mucilaginibacter sp. PAMB04274 TaxID=3138568 RepID=UPI0031F628D3